MKRWAAIDIGSNSVRFLAADVGLENKIIANVWSHMSTTRLGEGLGQWEGKPKLGKEAMARTIQEICLGVERLKELNVHGVAAFATAAVRESDNGGEFCRLVSKGCGIKIKVLTGEEEGQLSYEGAVGALDNIVHPVVLDIGGGSAEVVFAQSNAVLWRASYPLGAVRITERGWGIKEIKEIYAPVKDALSDLNGQGTLVAVGGTATSSASMALQLEEYDPDKVQGTILSLEKLRAMREHLLSLTIEARKQVKGLQPQRADIIPAGLLSMQAFMEVAGFSQTIISESDLLSGAMIKIATGQWSGG